MPKWQLPRKLAVERHEEVEVLLENYHRRLVLIRHQMGDLMNRVRSAQEVGSSFGGLVGCRVGGLW